MDPSDDRDWFGWRRRRREARLNRVPRLPSDDREQEMDVLREHPGELGALLWRLAGDVAAWAAAAERASSLRSGAHDAWMRERAARYGGEHPEVAGALRELAGLSARPGGADPAAVAEACAAVLRWARALGRERTALRFAELAARVEPGAPRRAFAAGSMRRQVGDLPLAESWMHRAAALARRAGRPGELAVAFLGWGRLDRMRRRPARAEMRFRVALRAALHSGYLPLLCAAHHSLAGAMLDAGRAGEALPHLAAAALHCSPAHWRAPRLGWDAGRGWVQRGWFSGAAAVLEASLPWTHEPDRRVRALACLARAAAAMGDAERYEQAREEALDLLPRQAEHAPGVLGDLALGALSLGRHDEADALALKAVERARERFPSRVEPAERLRARVAARDAGASAEPPGEEDAALRDAVLRLLSGRREPEGG